MSACFLVGKIGKIEAGVSNKSISLESKRFDVVARKPDASRISKNKLLVEQSKTEQKIYNY